MGKPQNSPEERINQDAEDGQTKSIEPDYFVIEEEGGKANLYEVNDHFGSKLLVQEYPDRAAAQEYIDYQQKIDEVAEKISEDIRHDHGQMQMDPVVFSPLRHLGIFTVAILAPDGLDQMLEVDPNFSR